MKIGNKVVIALLFALTFMIAYALGKKSGDKPHQEANTSRDQGHRNKGPIIARPPPSRPPPRIRPKKDTAHSAAKDDEESHPEQEVLDPSEEARRCATAISPDCGFLDPSPEELTEMARCATVKSDYPSGLITDDANGFPLSKKAADAAGLTATEKDKTLRATNEFQKTVQADLREILRGLDGSPDQIDSLTSAQLVALIRKHSVPQEIRDTRKSIARARAGQDPLPPPKTPTEQFEQLIANLGNAYEARLAEELGSARAAELRAIDDGWGNRFVSSGRCDEEED
ncbi:MAG TPA: hypothetical protein ENJ18_15190 [Nannocystis exedens]|nr:hypothetical protein [Nannocystis exedens]